MGIDRRVSSKAPSVRHANLAGEVKRVNLMQVVLGWEGMGLWLLFVAGWISKNIEGSFFLGLGRAVFGLTCQLCGFRCGSWRQFLGHLSLCCLYLDLELPRSFVMSCEGVPGRFLTMPVGFYEPREMNGICYDDWMVKMPVRIE